VTVTEPLTYVYCLVRSARRPVLRDVPPGLPGSTEPRALAAGGGLWAIVARVPAREYDEEALAAGLPRLDWVGRRAVAHEAVVEHFIGAAGLLPMQLFTLFTSDARVLEHVGRDRARIDGIFARIERQLEWGLRLTFDEKAARQAVERQHAGPSGAAYLARKRDLLEVTRALLAAAKADADRLYRDVSRSATESRRRTATEEAAPGSRLLLDAAFLVPSRRTGAFRSELRRRARALGTAGIVVSLTGPWPPYNFITAPARRPARGGTAAARPAPRAGRRAPRPPVRARAAAKRR
jgi:hypothetical protein